MFDRLVAAVIDALLAVPPVRFVMGLVDARWRPLWAALWIAVIAYVLSRTMNQLALRRARLRILAEPPDGRPLTGSGGVAPDTAADTTARDGVARERTVTTHASDTPAAGAPRHGAAGVSIPLPIVAVALIVGALAVIGVSVALRTVPNNSAAATTAAPVAAPPADSAAKPDAPIDVRYRSGRMDGDHCVGTFEVTQGHGTRARLVAFVMDTSGAVIGRDSARVDAAVPGIFVDFRFRYVECDEIDDWQIQATTPSVRR